MVVDRATCFPVSMARGATWDLDLEERIGEAIGRELRAIGADLYGGVCVNVLRHPAWGRAQETYGEDPHHVGEMGAALTRGIQRHTMACVKHFACNSMENARFKVDIEVDEVALHEVYLPHFKRIVDEGVAVVMSAYNSVNGEWCGDNRQLLTDILRDEWGFRGLRDQRLDLRASATPLARLQPGSTSRCRIAWCEPMACATRSKREDITWEQIDRSIERVLSTLLRFDKVLQQPKPGLRGPRLPRAPRARARSRREVSRPPPQRAGRRQARCCPSPVPTLRRVAVLGRLASIVNLGDGGSSDVWAPSSRHRARGSRGSVASRRGRARRRQ